ncbi:MAG: hypothetical protein O8C64_06355 [Candidatus Methanoperedens sp.]|nr:hypothetical protein [Candidatus Methanoperedens sp.]
MDKHRIGKDIKSFDCSNVLGFNQNPASKEARRRYINVWRHKKNNESWEYP